MSEQSTDVQFPVKPDADGNWFERMLALSETFRKLSGDTIRGRLKVDRASRRFWARAEQIEGESYNVPSVLHNGRKPTARRKR